MILFSCLQLPDKLVRQITDVQRGVAGARWVAPEKLHITTGYYGNLSDDQAEMLDDELAKIRISAFDLQLEGAGHFGSLEPRVLWLGVKQSDKLHSLHEKCRAAARRAGVSMEKRKYMPHVTVAYLPEFPPLDRVIAFEKRLSRFNTAPFIVDQMVMMSSLPKIGAQNIYREEATYPFLG